MTHGIRILLAALLALALAAASGTAFARRGGGFGGHGGHASFSRGAHSGGAHFRGGAHFGGFHRSRTHIGFFVGAPLFSSAYFPYYDYAYAPIYSAPLAIEYIEKEPQARSPNDYWYFCPDSKTYYPYVHDCSGGWQAVEPLTAPPVS